MDKQAKAAIGLLVLSNLAMVDAFVAVQPAFSADQSRDLLLALEKIKDTNQKIMQMAGYKSGR